MKNLITIIENGGTILQSLVLITIITLMLIKTERKTNVLLFVFYVFAMISFLFSDIYWIVYGFLRPGTRMPFAANEIGEGALFLLIGAALSYVFKRYKNKNPEAFLGVLFVVANAALWYGWSGELLQDTLTGIAFAYFIFEVVDSTKHTETLKKAEWRALGAGAFLLVLMQGATFILPPVQAVIADRCCYGLMIAGTVFFGIKTVNMVIKKNASPEQGLCIVWMTFAWLITSMYMSTGFIYSVFLGLCTLMIPCTYLAVRQMTGAGKGEDDGDPC